jgi:4-amino-4-deoxy-L-arabinose transferase-like glycosyltransferase
MISWGTRLYQRRPGLALFLLFLATSLATRGFLLGVDILDVDEAMHIVGSWQMLRGRHLYVGFVDNKPPLLYVYYAFAQLLFGRGMLAVHLLTVLLTVPLTALGVSSFFAHDRRGIAAGMIFLVFGAAFLAHDMHAANCEILMLLPATWAVAAVRDEERSRRARCLFWAGGLLGIAMLFKQMALVWSLALVLAAILANRGKRRSLLWPLLAFVTGLSIPLLAAWAVFAAQGESQAFLYWTVFFNFGYAQQPMQASEALVRIAKFFLPFLAATIGLWIMVVRSRSLLSRYQRVLVLGVLACTFPIVFVGFRMYPHYFVPLYTPLALGAAPILAGLCVWPLGRWAKLVLAYGIASLIGFGVGNGIMHLSGHQFHWEEYNTEYGKVADILRADACFKGASMFTWGPGPMFAYSADLPLASRFALPYSTICGYVPGNWAVRSGRVKATDVIRPEHWDQLMGDLERNRATYIIDGARAFKNWKAFPVENFPRMVDYIDAHYELIDTVGAVRVFRRRGCLGRAQTER